MERNTESLLRHVVEGVEPAMIVAPTYWETLDSERKLQLGEAFNEVKHTLNKYRFTPVELCLLVMEILLQIGMAHKKFKEEFK